MKSNAQARRELRDRARREFSAILETYRVSTVYVNGRLRAYSDRAVTDDPTLVVYELRALSAEDARDLALRRRVAGNYLGRAE